MSSRIITDAISQTNLKEKQLRGSGTGNHLHINLALLSDKNSMETLMSMAKKQKNPNKGTSEITKSPVSQGGSSITKDVSIDLISEDLKHDDIIERGEKPRKAAASTQKLGVINFLPIENNEEAQENIFEQKNELCRSVQSNKFVRKPRDSLKDNNPQVNSTIKCPRRRLFVDNCSDLIESKAQKETIYEQKVYSVGKGMSALEFSYKETMNAPYKDSMEDTGKAVDCFNNKENEGLFCLFDGHGGDSASKYLKEKYLTHFKQALELAKGDITLALKDSFKSIDKELEALKMTHVGSTGCVIYLTEENDTIVIYTANVGDTRCSLISPMRHRRLTIDHKVECPQEKQRIIDAGGLVIEDRVMGALALSRAFGDFELKSYGVIAEPHISRTEINVEEKSQILISASDGVWDMLSEEEIQSYIINTYDTAELCRTIVKNAIALGSWDNISCFAIRLT